MYFRGRVVFFIHRKILFVNNAKSFDQSAKKIIRVRAALLVTYTLAHFSFAASSTIESSKCDIEAYFSTAGVVPIIAGRLFTYSLATNSQTASRNCTGICYTRDIEQNIYQPIVVVPAL